MPEIVLLAYNIRSTHNVGSIFRTAEGFGVQKIILTGYTPYPDLTLCAGAPNCAYGSAPESYDPRLPHIREKLTRQIHKTALGAEALVPFEYYDELDTWLAANKDSDRLPVIALEQTDSSLSLRTFRAPKAFALLIGEEVNGIEKRYLESCDTALEIPMHGQKESFNVSVATGIALFHLSS